MSLTASSRSVVNAPRMRRFSSSSTARRRAAAEDGHGQQRAAVEVGEVRVAGEAVVAGGVGHDQRFTGPLDVAQHRHRHCVFVAGAADRRRCRRRVRAAASRAGRRSTAAGARRWRRSSRRAPRPRGRAAGRCWSRELSACDADRMPSRSSVPVRDRGAAARTIGGLVVAAGGRVGLWSQGGVGPVELVDLRGRAPGERSRWRAWASRS